MYQSRAIRSTYPQWSYTLEKELLLYILDTVSDLQKFEDSTLNNILCRTTNITIFFI